MAPQSEPLGYGRPEVPPVPAPARRCRKAFWPGFPVTSVLLKTGILGLGFCAWSCDSPGRKSEPAGRILLILVDALRADHLGSYGHARPTSPNLDDLARESVLCESAISPASWTLPAVSSLFTGLYPIRHGVLRRHEQVEGRVPVSRLGAQYRTLAESFSDAGYATAAFVANPFLERVVGLDQGFQTYRHGLGEGEEVVREFWRWYDDHAPPRFFAYLHFMDVHWPYERGVAHVSRLRDSPDPPAFPRPDWDALRDRLVREPETFSEAEVRELALLYDGAVYHLDGILGAFFRELKGRGLAENLLLVVTSDHGEEFREHGTFLHIRHLFDSVVRVPLLIRFPGGWKGGTRIHSQVRLVDVAPTLLASAGLDPGSGRDGRSLLPLLEGPEEPPEWPEFAFSEFLWSDRLYRQSIRSREYKLVRTFQRSGPDPAGSRPRSLAPLGRFLKAGEDPEVRAFHRLYLVGQDPGETVNWFERRPEIAGLLLGELDRWFGAHAAEFDAAEAAGQDLSEMSVEALKGLGYLQ